MLGNLPLSEVRGPRDDLETKLAGANGRAWLDALRRFLREEPQPAQEQADGTHKVLRPVGAVVVP
ncbi:MAG: hypothetical protein AAB967_00130, partial [Patescibacteria group bacterium]